MYSGDINVGQIEKRMSDICVNLLRTSIVGLMLLLLGRDTDAAISTVWGQIRSHWVVKHESFEPFVAVSSFFVFLQFFALMGWATALG
jgi:hypothetical protein